MPNHTTEVQQTGKTYDAAYYSSHCGPVPYTRNEPQWSIIFGTIADHLIRSLRPRRVFDLGCALGFLVEAFWDRGVECSGVDISQYAIDNVRPDIRNYCHVGSVEEPITGGPFDLITCFEVLEHVSETAALAAIANIAGATETVLFSSSPYDFVEPTHLSVRPTAWWLRAFEANGFRADLCYDASFVAPHAMLLRRSAEPHPADVRQAFTALLRLRHENTDKQNRLNEGEIRAASLRNDIAVRDQQLSAAQAASVQAETELDQSRAELAGLGARLEQAGQENAQLRIKAGELESELAKAQANLAVVEEIQHAIQSDLQDAIHDLVEYIRRREREDAGQNAAHPGTVSPASSAQYESILSAVDSRLKSVESSAADARRDANAIMESKIWRTLVGGGRVLERIVPGRPVPRSQS